MDEDDRLAAREHDVRAARKTSLMQSIAVSESEQGGSQHELRPSVLSANAAHHPASYFWRDDIGHRADLI